MKDWFKYGFGFVNLDEENLFLTNSGNWSETEGLLEKGIEKEHKFRKFRIQLFLIIVALLFVVLYWNNMMSDKLSLLFLFILPVAYYFLYKYMKSDIGAKYKLPINQISAIKIEEQVVTIYFVNGKGEGDVEKLRGVEPKGVEILRQLQAKI